MAFLFFVRAAGWAIGCSSGPPDGAPGGKCKDNGCNLTCDEGLVCDNATDTCGAESNYGGSGGGSSSGGDRAPCGFIGSSPHCNADEELVACSSGSPQFSGYLCRAVSYDNSQGAYCCATCDGSACDGGDEDGGDASIDDASDAADTDDAIDASSD